MNENPVNAEVQQFNKGKLKKTETAEKNHKPTKEGRCYGGKECALNIVPISSLSIQV